MPIKAPLSWLKEYVDINVPVEELARRLTLAGIEVERIVEIGAQWENSYTGLVTHLEKHPNADRLWLATVQYGPGKQITVVTGAPNIREGDKVVVGLVGSLYLDQHVSPPKWSRLKPASIRGVQTEGMVMSEAELGLSDEHEGIIVLDPSTPIGIPAREALGDTVLEIEVTPNNGRILSMIGLAREIAAQFGGEVRYPSAEWEVAGPPVQDLLGIEIDAPDLCPRYSAAVIQGVKIEASPQWMQRRLALAGVRSINNVVDITNYIMLEMGQPLHAFNYNTVEGHRIVVRRAHPGEHIVTLDHVERALDSKMLVIADIEKPLGLAGVMGGLDSEIQGGEGDVLLEAAHFNPLSVRRTARLLKLPSEASYRFERFVDPELTVPAMKRAAQLMNQLAGGTIADGYADVYPLPYKPRQIYFYTSEVERLLGVKVPPSEIAGMLRKLDFNVDLPHNADAIGQDTTMLVDVPTYRNDIALPCDLVEEVARMLGYDRIPETLLTGGLPPQELNRSRQAEEDLRDTMAAAGLDEVINYSVTASSALHKLASMEAEPATEDNHEERPRYRSWNPTRPLVTIINPLSNRHDVMRPTLFPNMLDTLRMNLRYLPDTPIRIFELGHVYLTPTPLELEERRAEIELERIKYPRLDAWPPVEHEDRLPLEPHRLMALMSGPRHPRDRFHPDSEAPQQQMDFFDAKGVIERLLRRLHLSDVAWLPVHAPLFNPGRVALVRSQSIDLGVVGELHPALIEAWEIPAQRVAAWDLDVEALIKAMPERVLYKEVSPYQPERQDMAFIVEQDTPEAAVAAAIKKAGGHYIMGLSLFDVYTGPPVLEGRKSLAFAVTLNSIEKPLTEEEIARIRKRIEAALQRELGAEMRA